VYSLLEPGPVVLVTTAHNGRNNIMTMAWYTMMEFEPPLIGCVISELNYSFAALKATGECVIAVPSVELAETAVHIGNTTGRDTDKFAAFGLTAAPASRVGAPLIAECFANFECHVVDTSLMKKYDFFVLEAVKAWIDPSQKEPKTIHHHGKGIFVVDGKTIRIPSKMK
jgi:flavin reductase (DIM6/NTAB) family NADH-FMN oxidoreductase RutF